MRGGSLSRFALLLRPGASSLFSPQRLRFSHAQAYPTLFQRVNSAPNAVLGGLVLANVGVWGLWQTADRSFMARHFTVCSSGLQEGRLHTLVTSAFSQVDGFHLGGNMLSLFFFGKEVGQLFGGTRLLGLYVVGGVASSLAHVAWDSRRMEHQRRLSSWFQRRDTPALGASGAVNAIILFDAMLFPTRIIYVNLILPVPSLLLAGGLLMRDVWASDRHDGVAHAGHIGGAVAGFAAWAWLRLRRPGGRALPW
jgi:membrane associated rhomboid family serine protease